MIFEQRKWDAAIASTRETIVFGRSVVAALLAINGGAAAGLLTLLGYTIASKNKNDHLFESIFIGIEYFIIGIVFATITSMLSYMSQWFFSSFSFKLVVDENSGNILRILEYIFQTIAVISAIAALTMFCLGVWRGGQLMIPNI